VLVIAVPLIVSTSSHTLQMFIDGIFLMWYDADAMSSSMMGGILSFTIICLFWGTVTYVNTFVAQYTGAGRQERLGPAVWQGIWFSVGAGVIMLGLIPAAPWIFSIIGHSAKFQEYQVGYFQILCLGSPAMMLSSTLSCFYSGRGKTMSVMYVSIGQTIVNIVLDYCMIFGKFGMPAMGIRGAAYATAISSVFATVVLAILFLSGKNRKRFATASGWRFEKDLFKRLVRYGLPSGVQAFFDMLSFTVFIAMLGRIGEDQINASTVALRVNTLGFMPMVGMGIAVSTLVGQELGRNNPALAQRYTWTASHMSFVYISTMAAGFWFLPELFMYPFSCNADPQRFAVIAPTIKKLLAFVAIYSMFDTGNVIFSAALKGAGDTRFVMVMSLTLHWVFLGIPAIIASYYNANIYIFWIFLTVFVCLLAVAFLLRFLQGRWKTMRVIENAPVTIPSYMPEMPTVEVD